MAHIRFKDSEEYIKADVRPIGSHIVRINLATEPVLTGFHLFIDKDGLYPLDNGEYENFTTLYRRGDGWYELSNDGSEYVEQEEAEPSAEPTEEEIAEREKQQQRLVLRAQITELKSQLDSTDYQIIKTYEYSLVGLDPEYDITALHRERQTLRDRINALQTQLNEI